MTGAFPHTTTFPHNAACRPGRGLAFASPLLVLALLAGASAVHGETPAATAPLRGTDVGPQSELRGVEDTLHASEAQRRKLEAEIGSLQADRARLNAALIDTTAQAQAAEVRVGEIEKRLTTMTASETAIRRSLASRRDVIAGVLAALQRMGRKPPPAVLVRPDDMLRAIRTSMLLGAVVPELRAETETLANDLAELVRLRQAIAAERTTLQASVASLSEQRRTLAALVAARQQSLTETQKALDAEGKRAAELAQQAQSLKDLIARAEGGGAATARATELARKAEEARRIAAESESREVQARIAAAPFKDPARLAPQIAFAAAKGLLPLPAVGTKVKSFGEADGFGGVEKGLSLSTSRGAVVASPADGWVAFAGPYRTYGQVLIINAGNGYYIVLAGMERISVATGQFVLVGEPVATMGDGATRTTAAMAIGATAPILYVEFRKDGAAIDPGPWWAKADIEKVRG